MQPSLFSVDLEPRMPSPPLPRELQNPPEQDAKAAVIYKSITEAYKKQSKYFLMGLDELTIRLFFFALVVSITRSWPFWMVFGALLCQLYYLALMVYHRPFSNRIVQWCEVFTNASLVVNLCFLVVLTKTLQDIEYLLLCISIVNFITLIGALLSQVLGFIQKECISPQIEMKEEEENTNENTQLIPNSSSHKGSGELFAAHQIPTTTILDSDSD